MIVDPSLEPPLATVREAVARALSEDVGPLGDLTGGLLPTGSSATARIVPRSRGVLAGRMAATEVFSQVDPQVLVEWHAADGCGVVADHPVATVSGPLASILVAERTALNFLGHLSGVATLTHRYVDAVHAGAPGSLARVRDTRKTTPGLRSLEKAAVRAGGGLNHRGSLSDGILLKDNHLAGLAVGKALADARYLFPGRPVQVECESADDAEQAALAGADLLLLDNMDPAEVAVCVARLRASSYGGIVEVSGGITLDNVVAYAAAGAQLISVGALTHSAPTLDLGLDVALDVAREPGPG